jgi:hypothetical protein
MTSSTGPAIPHSGFTSYIDELMTAAKVAVFNLRGLTAATCGAGTLEAAHRR